MGYLITAEHLAAVKSKSPCGDRFKLYQPGVSISDVAVDTCTDACLDRLIGVRTDWRLRTTVFDVRSGERLAKIDMSRNARLIPVSQRVGSRLLNKKNVLALAVGGALTVIVVVIAAILRAMGRRRAQ